MARFIRRWNKRGGRAISTLERVIIKNSATVKVGGFVLLSSGFAAPATAGAAIYGLCVGIVTQLDIPLDSRTVDPSAIYDGTFVAGINGSYAAASNNQTVKKICAQIDITPDLVVSSAPDAAIGTTTGSDLKGNYTDLVDDITVDENNNGNSFTASAQLAILGVDPQNSANGLYTIHERQMTA